MAIKKQTKQRLSDLLFYYCTLLLNNYKIRTYQRQQLPVQKQLQQLSYQP